MLLLSTPAPSTISHSSKGGTGRVGGGGGGGGGGWGGAPPLPPSLLEYGPKLSIDNSGLGVKCNAFPNDL